MTSYNTGIITPLSEITRTHISDQKLKIYKCGRVGKGGVVDFDVLLQLPILIVRYCFKIVFDFNKISFSERLWIVRGKL